MDRRTRNLRYLLRQPGYINRYLPYVDPDGPGPIEVVGSDFTATGSITIVQLDETGYEFVVHELVFADGPTFNEFTVASQLIQQARAHL